MRQFVMNVEPRLIKQVDRLVKEEGYPSRNEFVRDAIRSRVEELERLKIRKALKKLAKKAVKSGWDGSLLTQEEREKIFQEFIKEKGFELPQKAQKQQASSRQAKNLSY